MAEVAVPAQLISSSSMATRPGGGRLEAPAREGLVEGLPEGALAGGKDEPSGPARRGPEAVLVVVAVGGTPRHQGVGDAAVGAAAGPGAAHRAAAAVSR